MQGVGDGQTDASKFVFGMIIKGGVDSVVAQDTFLTVTNSSQYPQWWGPSVFARTRLQVEA